MDDSDICVKAICTRDFIFWSSDSLQKPIRGFQEFWNIFEEENCLKVNKGILSYHSYYFSYNVRGNQRKNIKADMIFFMTTNFGSNHFTFAFLRGSF